MLYLLATILLNVVISVIIKLFSRYDINALQAIVANYVVCVVTGCLFMGSMPFTAAAVGSSWFPWALLMGAGFIGIFNLMAYSTRIDGITTTTIANKLSLVIPVLFSLIVYREHAGIGKIVGIVLAFPAVYLTSRVTGDDNKPQNLFWPAILFGGSGSLDTIMNYVQQNHLTTPTDQALFTVFCFAVAGSLGVLLMATLVVLKKIKLQWRNLIAGICLGIPNYFSIYFFIRALNSDFLQSSASIPVMNIGILVASSLTALLVFREKANALRYTGLVLSVIAILLIAFGDK
jgi:drug/metabolite transporter (DMT)-like permease